METFQMCGLLTQYLTEPEFATVTPMVNTEENQASFRVSLDDGSLFEVTVAKV